MTRLAASTANTRSENARVHTIADASGSPLLNAVDFIALRPLKLGATCLVRRGATLPETPRTFGRKLSVDHAMAIMTRIRKYNGAVATQIASAFVYPAALLVFPRVELKPEEEVRRLKAKLLAIGTSIGVGDQLVEEALKTP